MAGFHRQRRRSRRQPPESSSPEAPPAQPDAETAASTPPDTEAPDSKAPARTGGSTPRGTPPDRGAVPRHRDTAARDGDAAGVPSPADVAAAGRGRHRAEASTVPTADLDEPREPVAPDREAERGLRGLVGSGSSQVGPWAAARARDASRPTDEDLRRAAEEVVIVRRNWVPREPFRPGGKS